MSILPLHDRLLDQGIFSKQELAWIAAAQYFMIIISFLTFSWIVVNVWRILIKQRKYKVLPLLSFYTAAALNVILRLVSSIWFFNTVEDHQMTILVMDILATKFMIGIDHTWINIELCLIINYSLKSIQDPTSRPIFPIRHIKFGRIATVIFIAVFFTTINAIQLTLRYSKKSERDISDFVLNQFSDTL